jgi:hypothetical protein
MTTFFTITLKFNFLFDKNAVQVLGVAAAARFSNTNLKNKWKKTKKISVKKQQQKKTNGRCKQKKIIVVRFVGKQSEINRVRTFTHQVFVII